MNIRETTQDLGVAFGTSGVRGLVREMTPEVCFAYTCAFLALPGLFAGPRRVVVGMDLRPSSPAIAASCLAAVAACGCEAVFCGATPTPALAFFAQKQGCPAIMVTGSHIPFDRNGIKFYRHDGEITKSDEAAIVSQPFAPMQGVPAALPAPSDALQKDYRQRYLSFFPENLLLGKRIGVFEHSSVARDFLLALLADLGATPFSLGRSDAFVPIDTEAVDEDLARQGRIWAQELGLDAILSTDGDADRPLLADATGEWLRGDLLGLLTARYLGLDALATPINSNTLIERSGFFREVRRTRIGSPYVIAGMQELQAQGWSRIGGFEANGGFLLFSPIAKNARGLDALPTRDAILPMLAALALAQEQGLPLARLCDGLPQRHTASARLKDIPAALSNGLLKPWQERALPFVFADFGQVVRIDLTDGLRLFLDTDEILHFRPSGNAPELRCYAEADSREHAAKLCQKALIWLTTQL